MASYLVDPLLQLRLPEQIVAAGETIRVGNLARVSTTPSAVTVKAPSVADESQCFAIVVSGANAATVDGNGRTINGGATAKLPAGEYLFVLDGGTWVQLIVERSFGPTQPPVLRSPGTSGGSPLPAPGNDGEVLVNIAGAIGSTPNITCVNGNPFINFGNVDMVFMAIQGAGGSTILQWYSGISRLQYGNTGISNYILGYDLALAASSASGLQVFVAGGFGLRCTNTVFNLAQPLAGDARAPVPLRVLGTSKDFAGASTYTMLPADYEGGVWEFSGSPSGAGGGTIVTGPNFPNTDVTIDNSSNVGPVTVTTTGIAATGVTVAAGKVARVRIKSSGGNYIRVTPDA